VCADAEESLENVVQGLLTGDLDLVLWPGQGVDNLQPSRLHREPADPLGLVGPMSCMIGLNECQMSVPAARIIR
jgi:hypothetical protein